jgi:hypothetical protein
VADEQVLHLAAAIDENRIGMLFQELERFLGSQVLHDRHRVQSERAL